MSQHVVILCVHETNWGERYTVEVYKQTKTALMENLPFCYCASNDESVIRKMVDGLISQYNAMLIDQT